MGRPVGGSSSAAKRFAIFCGAPLEGHVSGPSRIVRSRTSRPGQIPPPPCLQGARRTVQRLQHVCVQHHSQEGVAFHQQSFGRLATALCRARRIFSAALIATHVLC